MAEEEKKSGTYEAGCHCGYIKFSITLSPPLPEYTVLDCGCSASESPCISRCVRLTRCYQICAKSGYLLVCKSFFYKTFHLEEKASRV